MWTIILVLIAVGLLMVLLEILVIPGGGFAGIIGFAIMAAAVFLGYSRLGEPQGHYILAGTVLINVSVLALALRSKTWTRLMLVKNIDSRVNTFDDTALKVGDKGITISRCTPSGKALINNVFYEVHSLSEFIDEEQEIEIIKIESNKIFIKTLNK
ncbi:MAG: hypothetical protein RBR87_15065 [Bacteroidales bacterium]|jgi:membrane-bound ClpP family serine protease|nr:hypothetical protein [Bacteroidales bacterium]